MTRQEYLAANTAGTSPHREYYGQFVNKAVKDLVLSRFSKEKLTEAIQSEKNLNSIPLAQWDGLTQGLGAYYYGVAEKMKELGDYRTLAGSVCILKEAARQIVEEETEAVLTN